MKDTKEFVVPEAQLTAVSVSRLQTASCQRKYFWRYICGLESRGMSMGRWVGSLVHAGIQARFMGGNAKLAQLAIRRADREKTSGLTGLSGDMLSEMTVWRALAPAMVEGFVAEYGHRLKLRSFEEEFSLVLPCGLTFHGLIDGLGTYDKESALVEIKCLGQVSKQVFDTMAFNGQVHSYLSTRPEAKRPKQFVFCVIRKPSKWVKRGQSIDEFIAEIKADLIARPDFYFIVWVQPVGDNAIRRALDDVDAGAEDLKCKYARLGGAVRKPECWARDDRQCHEYGGCEYLPLCKDMDHWKARATTIYQPRQEMFLDAGA
jgi:hypothetical protein